MSDSGEKERETIRPEFNPAIMIDFQGAKITSDTGFLLLREIDERFGILGPIESELEDARSWVHSTHTQLQMVRQRVYQIAAGYEDCNDADFLRIDPALRLAIGKEDKAGAGQSRLSRLENEVLGTEGGLKALEDCLMRSNDALIRRKKKQRLMWTLIRPKTLLTASKRTWRSTVISEKTAFIRCSLSRVTGTA